MENIFSFKRFWLLVRKHASDNWKIFLVFLIILTVPALFINFSYSNFKPDTLFAIYIFSLVVIGGYYTYSFFLEWTNTSRSVSSLTLPVSSLEKIAVVLFYTVIVFVPVFTIVFYGSNVALWELARHRNPLQISFSYIELTPLGFLKSVLLPYTFFQSLILFSTVWLKRMQFGIAFVTIGSLIYMVFFWNIYYLKSLTGGTGLSITPFLFFPTEVRYFGPYDNNFSITSPMITYVSRLLYIIMTMLFYFASYFKLKEKEI